MIDWFGELAASGSCDDRFVFSIDLASDNATKIAASVQLSILLRRVCTCFLLLKPYCGADLSI